MPKGIPLTNDELSRRRREIFAAATHLFVEKGFNETSMREIGDAAGIGKSTLYDYFPSKDEILISFVMEEVRQMTAWATEIVVRDMSASKKLRLILERHLEYMVDSKQLYLKLTLETQRLNFESQQRVQTLRHTYQDMLCDLVREGMHDGEFRLVNPLMAVRGMLAMLTSAIYTSRPTGTPKEMLHDAFDIIFKGLEIG